MASPGTGGRFGLRIAHDILRASSTPREAMRSSRPGVDLLDTHYHGECGASAPQPASARIWLTQTEPKHVLPDNASRSTSLSARL